MKLRLGWVDSYANSYAIFGFVKATVSLVINLCAKDYYKVDLRGCGSKRTGYGKRFTELDAAKLFAEQMVREHYESYAKIAKSLFPPPSED